MVPRTPARLVLLAFATSLLAVGTSCKAATVPSPVLVTQTFTGQLPLLGVDFKTFTINYTLSATDLSVTVTTLTTVANSTPVTGVTLGVAFGVVSLGTCVEQISNPVAPLNQELFAPNGASAGGYCVQLTDKGTLTEAVNYNMTVKHY